MIFFNVAEAREFLLKNRHVLTLREERREGITEAAKGFYYKYEVLMKVNVSFKAKIFELNDLIPHVENSGFYSPPTESSSLIMALTLSSARWASIALILRSKSRKRIKIFSGAYINRILARKPLFLYNVVEANNSQQQDQKEEVKR